MTKKHIGFLHPGAMGISLAVTAQNTGHTAYWAATGRSSDTTMRAEKHNLLKLQTIEELCNQCSVIICVCPPHAATDVAKQVLDCSFKGIYADVNAISPQRVRQIGEIMSEAGVTFVDGGIIGGPAWTPNTTRLYLSGHAADQVADCFKAGPLVTDVIGDDIGKASALKMCYAANTKGMTALLCAIVAAADTMGVREELENHWSLHGSEFAQQTQTRIRRVTAKAWRFSGEMEEIAATFAASGLPGGFHLAAKDVYDRIAGFKGADPIPPVEDVLDALLNPDE
ncbi:MAG: NAD(P)-dependent oxidoreductase [Chloroflexi bacterium]|nr:MAG: NAD(P)-dependent oxidoreductase [Chloroflexota bacterium]